MRIILRNAYGRDECVWVVPDDFVDLGRWSQVETGRDRVTGWYVAVISDTDDGTNADDVP